MSPAIEYSSMETDDIDPDLDDMMDMTWIDEIRKTENVYNKYYVSPMWNINVFFLLVCGDDMVGCETGCVAMGTPNVVGWDEMLPLISEYISRGYVLSKRLKYSVTASPDEVLNNRWEGTARWDDVGKSCDIHFGDITEFMHDTSCVACVMMRGVGTESVRSSKSKNATRRVYVNLSGMTGRTRKNRLW